MLALGRPLDVLVGRSGEPVHDRRLARGQALGLHQPVEDVLGAHAEVEDRPVEKLPLEAWCPIRSFSQEG